MINDRTETVTTQSNARRVKSLCWQPRQEADYWAKLPYEVQV